MSGPFSLARSVLRLGDRATWARGCVVATLVAIERLLVPAAAYLVWVEQGLRAIITATLLAALLASRRVAERTFAVRAEARLYRRVVHAIVGGDVLRPILVRDQETRLTLFNSLNRIARLLAEILPHLAANIVASLVLLTVIVTRERGEVTMVSVMAVLCAAAVLYATRGAVARAQERSWGTWDEMADAVEDACEGRLELVASGRTREFLASFVLRADKWDRTALRAARVSFALGRFPVAALAGIVGAAVIVGARMGGASWSAALLEALVLATFSPAFLGVARCLQELVDLQPRVIMVDALVRRPSHSVDGTRQPRLPPKQIEWRDVRYAYAPDAPDVLRSLSFVWPANQVLTIAGANGSGKSTCLRVLLGLARPAAGSVWVDEIPAEQLDLQAWRRNISFLPQRPYLPERASLRQAMRLLDPELADDQMLRALATVDLRERLAKRRPDPLEVRIGELSAGERQRVAIARALCRDAPIVLLDEPDANLDADGIRLVATLIRELGRRRMVLVIAHTAELLATSDRVLTLQSGALISDVARGRKQTVMDTPA